MKIVDFGLYIVIYNFIIGVLLMIASEKLGTYAGHLMSFRRAQVSRVGRIGTFTLGACVATLSAGIYLAGHVFKV